MARIDQDGNDRSRQHLRCRVAAAMLILAGVSLAVLVISLLMRADVAPARPFFVR